MARTLPPQVQRELEEAELAQAQLIAGENPVEQEQAQEPPADPQPAPTESPAEPAPPAPPEEQAAPADPEPLWEKRYKTLKGMFDKEVPRLNALVSELQSQLAARKAQPEPVSLPTAAQSVLTNEDIETYGPELIDVIRRATAAGVEASVGPLRAQNQSLEAELAELRGMTSSVAARTEAAGRQSYLNELGTLVPDWAAINADEGFLAWLAEPDDMYGIQRNEALQDAYSQQDVRRTASIFNAWKTEAGYFAPPPPEPAPAPRPDLRRQVSPGNSKASAAMAAQNPATKVWTTAEIDAFYKDRTRGAFNGTAEDVRRIENEINLAVAEGRVR